MVNDVTLCIYHWEHFYLRSKVKVSTHIIKYPQKPFKWVAFPMTNPEEAGYSSSTGRALYAPTQWMGDYSHLNGECCTGILSDYLVHLQ